MWEMKAIEGHERLGEKHDELAIYFECSKIMVLFWEREVKRRELLLGIAMLSRICSGGARELDQRGLFYALERRCEPVPCG